ncbi:galactokinase [Bifidobacterium bombi]|uniref:Galactokinase n=1 Tax=Bifidobacterium bombi DSM 19703 TaxID=1341695 RepID=A0A080N224_9BIFI|nr:galactokinase [Bifidobacterium bombi]KFF30977.1 Galactokinase [Bifidobacterium bombi DSM 19703]
MSDIEFLEAYDDSTGAALASGLFAKVFGSDPDGVWAAPGRVNLIGEHTDYNAGLCLPIALPHRTYVAVHLRDDMRMRVVSSVKPEDVVDIDLEGLGAGGVKGWAAYPIGVAWALREAGFDTVCGSDMAFVTCVPFASGLSSSAAMTCSTALALDGVFGLGFGGTDKGRITLIDAAVRAENDMAGASTGGLDQSAAMRCTPGHSLRLDFRPGLDAIDSATQEPFDLEELGLELLVIDTQAHHQLNDGQYGQRRSSCERAARELGVANLREVADEVEASDDPQIALARVLNRLDDETTRKRVRHVVNEIGRVDRFIKAFASGDAREAGKLMDASHASLCDDYEVTVPELDVAVAASREAGALGARMTGGGFGGSVIALVARGESRAVACHVAGSFADNGFRTPRALVAVASDSAHRVR